MIEHLQFEYINLRIDFDLALSDSILFSMKEIKREKKMNENGWKKVREPAKEKFRKEGSKERKNSNEKKERVWMKNKKWMVSKKKKQGERQ